MNPKISIVGAGPGDPELITLKAANAIRSAKVVLYDALVNQVLLDLAPTDCELIYVGKRAGLPYLGQAEIKLLLVQSAFRCGHVVRLKGGDPMIFGRGFEELDYARSFGIETEVIPGISSVNSAATAQGVPLTHRGLARSFWVMTATAAGGEINPDLSLACESGATVVILMGMGKLSQITALYRKAGKDQLPAMVIQHATLTEEKHVVGTIGNLDHLARVANIGTPGIIVVGEVVRLHPELLIEQTKTHVQ